MRIWAARIMASCSVLMALLLFYKFILPPESLLYFSKLGVDPWGRVAAGIIELIAAVLLLIPRLYLYGALLTFATMLSAIAIQFFETGIAVTYENGVNDKGYLFISACVALVSASYILFRSRKILLLTN